MRRIGLIWCHIALGCQSALAARPVARDEEIPFIRFIGSTAPRYIATSPAVISHPAFSRLRLFCQNPPQGISIVNLHHSLRTALPELCSRLYSSIAALTF